MPVHALFLISALFVLDMRYEEFVAKFDRTTPRGKGVMAKCPAHDDGKASLSIAPANDGGVLLTCHAGCLTQDIVGALGLTLKDLFAKPQEGAGRRFRGPTAQTPPRTQTPVKTSPRPQGAAEIEATYSYTDAIGREVYQAVRLKPKDFRQRHRVNGEWDWTMNNVERVLYRLPEVLKAETVWVVEGEKDCDNLAKLGICATTNVGGAKKWMDGYNESLKGRQVVICGDNDKVGQEHVEMVFESVANKAKVVRIVKLPGVKDVSDFIDAFKEPEKARDALLELAQLAAPHYGGVKLPIYSMREIEPHYAKMVTEAQTVSLDLGRWLPSFGKLRRITPGNVVLIVGDTGFGKTNVLLNVIRSAKHLPSLFFELELPKTDMFERFVAHRHKLTGKQVEEEYEKGQLVGADVLDEEFPNMHICEEGRMTLGMMETIVTKAELKMGVKPVLVAVDYAQLMAGEGKSRYEKASEVAEGLKILAKATKTIVLVSSQVDRESGRSNTVGVHSAKDSGSLENSAGLIIGMKRDEQDASLMTLRILKATKGGAGLEVACNYDGARATITERAKA